MCVQPVYAGGGWWVVHKDDGGARRGRSQRCLQPGQLRSVQGPPDFAFDQRIQNDEAVLRSIKGVVIRGGTRLLRTEEHLTERLTEVMIPQGKIGGHTELVGELLQYAIGLWVVIVDEISCKNDKGRRWVKGTDLGDSAAERCIGINT